MTTARIICGDALESLRTLESESVQCVVCSPPYYGLRDYGTAEWEGGDADCGHVEALQLKRGNSGGLSNQPLARGEQSHSVSSAKQFRDDCGLCGATRIDRQIGLESTPTEYIDKLVAVFREVRRVLRKDGVCWLNIGDSYAQTQSSGDRVSGYSPKQSTNAGTLSAATRVPSGLKPKDLCGMPWRLAFALQADGWWLRSDIIWNKPNPMPESVTDRPTKSHEYIFLLTKASRYYFDQEAVREPHWHQRPEMQRQYAAQIAQHKARPATMRGSGETASAKSGRGYQDDRLAEREAGRNIRSVWTIATQPYPEAHFATFPTELPRICILAGTPSASCAKCGKPIGERNEDLPDVQHSIQSEDFRQRQTPSGNGDILQSSVREQGGRQKKVGQGLLPNDQGIHPDLFAATSKYLDARLCDGTSDSHGASVGEAIDIRRSGASPQRNQKRQPADEPGTSDEGSARSFAEIAAQADSMPALRRIDKDVRACAACGADLNAAGATSPAVVLDPFAGSGTTLQVALELGRAAIGIELNTEYVALANRRLNSTTLGLPLEIAA